MKDELPMESAPGTQRFYSMVKLIGAQLERDQNAQPIYPTDPIHAAAETAKSGLKLLETAHSFNYKDGEKENMTGAAIRTAAHAIRFLMNLDRLRVHKSQLHKNTDFIKEVKGDNSFSIPESDFLSQRA